MAWTSGINHFLAFGIHEDRDYSPYFDLPLYLADNPDVAAAVKAGGLRHRGPGSLRFCMASSRVGPRRD